MDTTNPAVAPNLSSAIPSSTHSPDTINTILSLFIKSAATLEEIADRANVSIAAVLQCLDEQKPFLRNLLETLNLRVRLLASRAEAIAIEALNEIVLLADDKEACRKAASKLLSHFKRTPQRAANVSERPSAPEPRVDRPAPSEPRT